MIRFEAPLASVPPSDLAVWAHVAFVLLLFATAALAVLLESRNKH